MREEITSTVISQIHTVCPQRDKSLMIDASTQLDELVIDSLELLELVFSIESQFSIETDEKLMAELQTVGDIVDMVEQALNSEAA